jgi:hypothetical protein
MGIRHIHRFTLIVLILFSTEELTHAEMTTSQIAIKYSPSVVTIVALDENDQPLSLGSGFFINTKGDIATNHHVLQGSAKAIIRTTKGGKGEILEIIQDDPELDLIVAKTSIKEIPPVPLGDSDSIIVGEDIVAIGNPAGLEGTISKGIISGIRKAEELKFIQITAPISPGSSGGPVFNMLGNVIGIATAYLASGQNLNFAMPVNYLKSLKPGKIKITSLPKAKYTMNSDDKFLVNTSEIHKNYCGDDLMCSIDFVLQNGSDYPVKNIKMLFIYRYHNEEYPTKYLELQKKWVESFDKPIGKQIRDEMDKINPIKEWDKIISYSQRIIKDSILPKLALRFSHSHNVNHCKSLWIENTFRYCDMEIRILDYEIDRTGSTPADLLFK